MGWQPTTPLGWAVYEAGFEYDAKQDIIRSRMDPWQWYAGFCWAYDCLCPAMLMIIDCETFYFTYGGKRWLIELWKGQYGIETGAEIGVYNCVDRLGPLHPANKLEPGVRNPQARVEALMVDRATFFPSARPGDLLTMSFTLKRDGKPLLHRGLEPHWWLTGFKWGVFTQRTSLLSMDIEIRFRNTEMCDQFRRSMILTGYDVPKHGGTSVRFTFDRPKTPQPGSRVALENANQAINQRLVEKYISLRDELHLRTNDPNDFHLLEHGWDAAQPVIQEVSAAAKKAQSTASATAKKAQSVASAAAKTLPSRASSAANKLHAGAAAATKKLQSVAPNVAHKISDDAITAHADIVTLFQKGLWRGIGSRKV